MPTTPLSTLCKNFQVFTVLDDGETFSGVKGSTIQVYPDDKHCSEDVLTDLENGRIPEEGDLAVVNLEWLINEALEANLESVQFLKVLLKK